MIRRGGCSVAAAILLLWTAGGGAQETPGRIDVHAHLWGANAPAWGRGGGGAPKARYGPPGPGRRPPPGSQSPRGPREETPEAFEPAVTALLAEMDRFGIAKAIVLPPPNTDANASPTLYPALREVVRRNAGRLVLGGGGSTLSPILARHATATEVSARVRDDFRAKAEALVRDGIRSFGEFAALHLSMNEHHVAIEIAPDHPLFLTLAEVAGESGIPIDLHMEAVPADRPLPAGLSSRNPRTLRANISAFERLLAHDPRARIVWQHIGWDNTGGMTPELLRRLLAAHSNLYLALRVEDRPMMADRSTPMPNRIVDAAGAIRPEWRALFDEFFDRFVIGSDEFFGPPGTRAPQSFEETWRILSRLPPDLARKIGRENAARIYRLD